MRVPEPEIDWPAMQGRKDRVVEAMRNGVEGLLKANGVEMITARGRLAGGTRVSADGRELSSRSVLLAPGSVVALPPVPGVELRLTSDTASVVLVEDVAQCACEGFGLAGVSELAAHEAAVMAGEHRRLLIK